MYKEYFLKNPNFEDVGGLQALLKKLFRVMYLYDAVMKERGIQVNWKKEVLNCLGYFLDRTKTGGHRWWELMGKEFQ